MTHYTNRSSSVSSKKVKSNLFLTLGFMAVALLAFSTTSPASAKMRAYCTVASASGGQWWTWTKPTMQAACYTAFQKLLKAKQPINLYWRGKYSTTKLNKGTLKCKQGSKTVYGYGAQVFTSGLNMKNQLGWSRCYLKKVR